MLPQADTGQLADFIHCLVDDIICQQLLPRMFEPHEKKLGIKLSFRPEL